MATIYDVEPSEFIEQVAQDLKKIEEIKPPVWATYVKTGRHRERPPAKEDWWYTRAASVLRKVYKLGPIGTSKLRRHYGGKPNLGVRPEHTFKGSGNIIRKVLQQLEKAGFLRNETKALRKGRVVTPKGKSFLDKIASKLTKGRYVAKKKEPVKVEKKTEKPIKKEPLPKKPVEKESKIEEPKKEQPKPKKPEAPRPESKKLSNESEKGLEKSKTFQKGVKAPEKKVKDK
jgi:small subunit ribosomal protein S19e